MCSILVTGMIQSLASYFGSCFIGKSQLVPHCRVCGGGVCYTLPMQGHQWWDVSLPLAVASPLCCVLAGYCSLPSTACSMPRHCAATARLMQRSPSAAPLHRCCWPPAAFLSRSGFCAVSVCCCHLPPAVTHGGSTPTCHAGIWVTSCRSPAPLAAAPSHLGPRGAPTEI